MKNTKRLSKEELLKVAPQIDITSVQIEQLWNLLSAQKNTTQQFNLLNAVYYLGSLIIFFALFYFAQYGYSAYGNSGLLAIVSTYTCFFASCGFYFYKLKKWHTVGGISLFLALSLTPLITYCLQNLIGWWPGNYPGEYADFYSFIQGGWFLMEVATILLTLLTLYFIRFPSLALILYATLWFMSMDILPLLKSSELAIHSARKATAIIFGLGAIASAFWLDRKTYRDFAFWGYLFGVFSFWAGLSLLELKTEWENLGYCAINILLILLGPLLDRKVFVVFGTLGVVSYLGMLAYRHFSHSLLLPFLISLIGMGVLAIGVWVQRKKQARKLS